MSENIRKPPNAKKPFDPITPTHLEPEDAELLWDIRTAALANQETSEMRAVSAGNTSGSMHALPPHTLYTIPSGNSGIFGETVNAICKHLREQRWNIPKAIIQPVPLYEKLEWDMLTPKPFNGIFPFIIAGMQRPVPIPIYRDTHVQIILPPNTILCMLS